MVKSDLDIFLRDGFLLGTIRHNGYIDFGGINYGSGYDNDPDAWCLFNYREKLKNILRNTKYIYKDYKNFEKYCDIHATDQHKEYYKKKSYIDIKQPYGFEIYKDDIMILDGSYLYEHNNKLIHISCWKQEQNIVDNIYKRKSYYGENIFDKKDFFPKKKYKFYDSIVFVPYNYDKILKKTYGNNVFNVIFSKYTNIVGGRISKMYKITNKIAKPVDIFFH